MTVGQSAVSLAIFMVMGAPQRKSRKRFSGSKASGGDPMYNSNRVRMLAVSYALPPALFPQAIQIGRLLTHMPAEIGVVCGDSDESATTGGFDPGFGQGFVFRESVRYRPSLRGFPATLARRFVPFFARVPDEYRPWVRRAEAALTSRLRETAFQPNVLVTFGEPMSDHLLGLRLKARLGIPWIAHFSDPWADNPFRRYEYLATFVNRRLEQQVVQNADRIVVTSQETLDLMMSKYPPAWRRKACVLSHSFDPSLYRAPTRTDGSLVVRYLGNFYGHRSPVPLFRALKLLLDADPQCLNGVAIELVGQMPARMRLHRSLRALPNGLVLLRDTVPYAESLTLMSNSDLLLVIDGPDDLSVFLPSKLIDYLGAGVPILGIVPPGASAELLTRLHARVADPREPKAVAAALRSAIAEAAQRRKSPRSEPWGDPAIVDGYNITNVSAAFSRLVSDLLADTGGPTQ